MTAALVSSGAHMPPPGISQEFFVVVDPDNILPDVEIWFVLVYVHPLSMRVIRSMLIVFFCIIFFWLKSEGTLFLV